MKNRYSSGDASLTIILSQGKKVWRTQVRYRESVDKKGRVALRRSFGVTEEGRKEAKAEFDRRSKEAAERGWVKEATAERPDREPAFTDIPMAPNAEKSGPVPTLRTAQAKR